MAQYYYNQAPVPSGFRYIFQADFGRNKLDPTLVRVDTPDPRSRRIVTRFPGVSDEDLDDYKPLYAIMSDCFNYAQPWDMPNLIYEIKTTFKTTFGTYILQRYNRIGELEKTWTLLDAFPKSIDFGYLGSPTLEIDVEWVFQDYHED